MSAQSNEELKPLDPKYNIALTDAFLQHMTGREYGDEEREDAFEHFKAGFDENYDRRSQEAPQGERVAKLKVALLAIANERKNDEGIQKVIWQALDADKAEADREGKE